MDLVVEMVGQASFAKSIACLRQGGRLVVCGPPSGSRKDLRNALEIAAKLGVRAQVSTYGLTQANEVLEKMQKGELHGRAVLVPL